MAAFIVVSMLFSVYNQKNHHFCIDFYTYKICGNHFITAIFMSVKSGLNYPRLKSWDSWSICLTAQVYPGYHGRTDRWRFMINRN